jgi:hypothetical protein
MLQISGRVKNDLVVGDDGGRPTRVGDTGTRVQGNVAQRNTNAPSFIQDGFLNGESKSIATMPTGMLKIRMKACIGRDSTGEIAKSQSAEFFSSSNLHAYSPRRTTRTH